ncbi:MAG TPA: hypothetical protein PLZ86_03050, partial [bacterium]|nr:hypothetical protein [bacterium]
GAVPMANLGGTYQVGGRKTIINNVLSHEAFSAGATGYSISSSDATFNIAQDETASVHRYDFITMPLCPMFTQVDGYQEDCMVGEWPSMKLLEKVKGEMESRMAAGAKGLDILAGTSWPQTYDNQFIHLQTNTSGGLDQVPLGFLVTDFMGAQGGGCNCDMTGSPIALPTLIVILLSSAAMMGGLMLVRVRIRRK